ncbi:GNAT family N-acetyltransferase [Terriglobus tenax]|uniref:GNAT family N-acetyltransferase n=1 Tax=Terriglobus tenax TaxID=1111115 RepID=UPI0021E0CFD9|nr:GNAT family N-acetyltransferase [Terriglobus tenax]
MANVADADEIARHRGLMFLDMGLVDKDDAERLVAASAPWFIDVMKSGLYKGWVVEQNGQIVAGGGLHLSEIGPLPGSFRVGRSAHIANVYTHAEHRKRGVARSLLNAMLRWCQESGVDQVTLTASDDGRALYRSLEFEPQLDGMLLKLHRQ